MLHIQRDLETENIQTIIRYEVVVTLGRSDKEIHTNWHWIIKNQFSESVLQENALSTERLTL